VGQPYVYRLQATEPDGDPIIYALVTGTSEMHFNATSISEGRGQSESCGGLFDPFD